MKHSSFAKRGAIFVCGLLLATGSNAGDTAAESRNEQIVTAAFDRWAAGGSNFFNEMIDPDVVWTIEGSGPSAGTYQGLEDFMARAVRPFASRMSAPPRPTSKRVWADGDHVIIQWTGEGTARDGRPYRNRYVWIFRMAADKAVEVNAFLDLPAYDDVLRRIPAPSATAEGSTTQSQRGTAMSQQHSYVGMWVTVDGRIRQELLPNGRYDEARGSRKSAYQGRYEVRGNHIDYWDDTGFTADGTFVTDDELHHGGMIFRREK
jgi:ketosteroid isomerase-like protein